MPHLPPTLAATLSGRTPTLWLNPRLESAAALAALPVGEPEVTAARDRLARCAPLLARLFPELEASGGLIESPLLAVPALQHALCPRGRLLIKADHALPVAGSIKARGGIHEVLEFAETLALREGWIVETDERTRLAEPTIREQFSRYTVAVGSTGNLGLAIGIMAAALGFKAVVHMSADAKPWKKDRLRSRGVTVVEHEGQYGEAVAAGRAEADADPYAYFVDDEHSLPLLTGYAVAAGRLAAQLDAAAIEVDAAHPLFVYLPCGVGGAPAGVALGLKYVFGDAVHVFFAEPVASPCMLVQLASGGLDPISVYDIGLDNVTEADGLAVGAASLLAAELMAPLLAGVFTVPDDDLFRDVYRLHDEEQLDIEPSAAAAFAGPRWLQDNDAGRAWLAEHGLAGKMDNATHILWTTGGSFVPAAEHARFQARGKALLAR
ncbi:D-serine ammonia-lyase [Crenobacter cavernae]|uniref:Probable D-serine dehydratase n=1 Tax=Crenobacter cavernae TaxID=2290923 RepID=A0A345Y704_9NEIS|nr:D-serine ammonia-lyase [Crenobacter cavernae]AXK39706.1 D-serine ammonia-lyase [Crenobacter cavernae]